MRLVGRELEVARVERLLGDARVGLSGALVIRGEAGIGKTVLLEHAAQSAAGMRVLRVRGIESESGLPFAALVELVRPVEGFIDMIPPHLSDPIRGALSLGPPVAAAPLQLGVAVLSLMAAVADERPLVALVDDAQWIDGASAAVLLFAARRLGAEGIAMLFAVRDGEPRVPDTSGLAEFVLTGLDVGAAAQLLAEERLSERVLARLHEEVAGNPLALIEGARVLDQAERSGAASLPDLLQTGERIEQSFMRRLARLSDEARAALVVAAAADGSGVGDIAAALREREVSLNGLDEAEEAGIVVLRRGRIEFSHPLLRSVCYHAASAAERRAAHLALAGVLAPSAPARSVMQRAAAASEPDEELAVALEEVAAGAVERGAPHEAARALERAAALSPEPVKRARRRLLASQHAALAADFLHALTLARRGLPDVTDVRTRAAFDLRLGTVGILAGSLRDAQDGLADGAVRIEAEDPAAAARMLQFAAFASIMQGDCHVARTVADRAVALANRCGPVECLTAAVVMSITRTILAEEGGASVLLALHEQLVGLHSQSIRLPTRMHLVLSQQLRWTEKFEDAAMMLRKSIAAARTRAALWSLPYDLASLAEVELARGELTAAFVDASEAVQLAHDTGQASPASFALATLSRVEALMGREADCRAHAAEARTLAESLGQRLLFTYLGSALGLLELARSRPDEAIRALEPVAEMALEGGLNHPNVVPWRADLVEAYIRCERRADAERELERLERTAASTATVSASAAALRCRGLLAGADGFDQCFKRALELHARQPLPIDLARTELCLGERLRRARRRGEARDRLRHALDTFDRSGAGLFANLARAELLAAGESRERKSAHPRVNLTAQELQVAQAVAEGATNAEVATQLFLSTKTIEKHLTSVYRKLGLRSRAQLVGQFASIASR